MSKHVASTAVCNAAKEAHLFIGPVRNTEERCTSEVQEAAERAAARTLREAGPTNCFRKSIKKMGLRATGNVPHHRIHSLHGQLPVQVHKGGESKTLQMASEHTGACARAHTHTTQPQSVWSVEST